MSVMSSSNQLFLVQIAFSATGLIFAAAMLITGKDAGTYLPIFTSIAFAWLPSPLSRQTTPTQPPQQQLHTYANNV